MKKIASIFLITSSLLFANNNSIGLDTVVGATFRCYITNQIDMEVKDAAKVAGGILAAVITNNTRQNQNYTPNNYYEIQH